MHAIKTKKESEQKVTKVFDEIIDKMAKIAAAIASIALVLENLRPGSPYVSYWLVWFIMFCLIIFFLFKSPGSKTGKKVRRWCIIFLIISALFLGFLHITDSISQRKKKGIIANFEVKLRTLLWFAYEPIGLHQDKKKKQDGLREDIREELKTLSKNNINGLITFSSKGLHANIPQIAKKEFGFQGVIMGITDVCDLTEIQAAVTASPYVDAYCVGHMFTFYAFTENDLLKTIRLIRSETDLPVSTTLRPNGYKVFPKITKSIDWIFPDVHGNWYTRACVAEVMQQTKFCVKEICELQELYPNKPVLLKMISFPSTEVDNATPEEQYKFFRLLIEYVKSDMSFPERVYPSFFSAFDLPGKSPEKGWPKGERFLGFFDKEKKAKKVIINGNTIKVIDALNWSRYNISN